MLWHGLDSYGQLKLNGMVQSSSVNMDNVKCGAPQASSVIVRSVKYGVAKIVPVTMAITLLKTE